MDPAAQVVCWWVVFAATHTLMSQPPIRVRLVGRLGEQGFRGVYSLVALATFVPLVTTYFVYRTSRAVWLPALAVVPGVWWITMLVNFAATVFLVLGFSSPNPVSSLTGGRETRVRGILRITRHPGFTGFGLLGVGHLLVLRAPIDVAFFGGLLLYAILGAAHQDWRRRSMPELTDFFRETSFFPFVAIWPGKTSLEFSEFSLRGLAAAIVAFTMLFFFHDRLFG